MVSAASTEAGEAPLGHQLAPGVRVRPERSGLLFYQRQGPRLYIPLFRAMARFSIDTVLIRQSFDQLDVLKYRAQSHGADLPPLSSPVFQILT